MKRNTAEKIKNLADEIITLLKEEHPYISILITSDEVRIMEDLYGFPITNKEVNE